MRTKIVVPLARAADKRLYGGKAASLAQLIGAGFNVPDGFVIGTDSKMDMQPSIEQEILASFDNLGAAKVAVRSSAVAEDGANDAWAGQMDTFLNIGRSGLIEAVKKCWTSSQSGRAKAYAQAKSLEAGSVAVIVQAMVNADVSGVAFSVHPVSKDKNKLIIEAVRGLAESLVSGALTPDAYIIDKHSFKLLDSELTKAEPIITPEQLTELAKQIIKIEAWSGFAVDVEWAIAADQLYILQSRPITTLG